jgi:hypothetical protein
MLDASGKELPAELETTPLPGTIVRASSRRASVDGHGSEIVKPGCFTSTVLRCPCGFMWITFAIAIFFGMIPNATKAIKLDATRLAGLDTPTIQQQVDYYAWRRGIRFSDDIFSLSAQNHSEESSGPARLTTIFLYEALTSAGVVTTDGVDAMTKLESALYDTPLFADNCAPATNGLNASLSACATPSTLLAYLYVNETLHEEQCLAGWCDALTFQIPLQMCSMAPFRWGTYPCTSPIFDWRRGTLAPEAQWPALLYAQLCALPAPFDARNAVLRRTLLSVDSLCSNGTLSAMYARSVYDMRTASAEQSATAFYNANTPAVEALVSALDAAQDAVSATTSSASQLATSPARGHSVNAMWGPFTAGWFDPDGERISAYLNADLRLAVISGTLVLLVLLVNTNSALLTLAGIFEILWSLALASFAWM